MKSSFKLFLAVAFVAIAVSAAVVPEAQALLHQMVISPEGVMFSMTTLAANDVRSYEQGDMNDLPVIASDIIYEGAAVGDNGANAHRPLAAGAGTRRD